MKLQDIREDRRSSLFPARVTPLGVAVLSLALTAVGCEDHEKATTVPGVGVSAGELTLGQPAAFTGPSAGLGIEMWRGATAAFQEYNARATTKRRIRLATADDGYEAERAPAAVNRLVKDLKVFALFGGVGTPTILKALPVVAEFYKQDKLFYFSNVTGAQAQREPPYDQFVFNVRASYRDEAKALVDYFTARSYTTIGIFIQDDAYGSSGQDAVVRALSAKNLQVSTVTKYPRGQTYDVRVDEQLKALKDAGTTAIIAVGAYQACAALVRDARMMDWKVPIANLSFVGSDQLLQLLTDEEAKSGKPMLVNLINSQVVPSYNELDNLIVQQYRAAMEKYKPTSPHDADQSYKPPKFSFGSLEGYISARAFLAVLAQVQEDPPTRAGFMKTAENMGPFDIGLNALSQFAPDRHQALDTVWLTYASPKGWLGVDPRAQVLVQ